MIDIEKAAALANIRLTEDEKAMMAGRTAVLAESFTALDDVACADVLPLVSPLEIAAVLRDDVPRRTIARDELLAMAPEHDDGYFVVPKMID